MSSYLTQHNLPDILHVPGSASTPSESTPEDAPRLNGTSGKSTGKNGNDTNGNSSNGPQQPPPVPPRTFEKSFDDDFMGYILIRCDKSVVEISNRRFVLEYHRSKYFTPGVLEYRSKRAANLDLETTKNKFF